MDPPDAPATLSPDATTPSEGEMAAPPPGHRWWSPRRPWFPMAAAVPLAAVLTLAGMGVVDDRRGFEARIAKTEKQAREFERRIDRSRTQIAELERSVQRDRASGKECESASRIGVKFLDEVVRWLELSARNEQGEAEEVRLEINRLIHDANVAIRACDRGLQ